MFMGFPHKTFFPVRCSKKFVVEKCCLSGISDPGRWLCLREYGAFIGCEPCLGIFVPAAVEFPS